MCLTLKASLPDLLKTSCVWRVHRASRSRYRWIWCERPISSSSGSFGAHSIPVGTPDRKNKRYSYVASIYQSIEILSKEKGIDPQIVLDAVKDAMLAAARKHFRSQEDLVADLDESTGNISIYTIKQVVETVDDPYKQISVSAAKRISQGAQIGSEVREPKPTESL